MYTFASPNSIQYSEIGLALTFVVPCHIGINATYVVSPAEYKGRSTGSEYFVSIFLIRPLSGSEYFILTTESSARSPPVPQVT